MVFTLALVVSPMVLLLMVLVTRTLLLTTTTMLPMILTLVCETVLKVLALVVSLLMRPTST
ncbi:hypothetical protein J3Q64DRAFT_1754112, partial [Phycomyces blakesleeanus]